MTNEIRTVWRGPELDLLQRGWLTLNRYLGQSVYIFTEIGRLRLTLSSMTGGPQINFELALNGERASEDETTEKLTELSTKIAIHARPDGTNRSKAFIFIFAPKEYQVLRGELCDENGNPRFQSPNSRR